MFTARRKEAYEALHQETKHGAIANGREKIRQFGDLQPTASPLIRPATGRPERSIQRDAERGMKIGDRALCMPRGTMLDTGIYLDTLKNIPKVNEIATVKADLEAEKARLKKVGMSRRAAAGRREVAS